MQSERLFGARRGRRNDYSVAQQFRLAVIIRAGEESGSVDPSDSSDSELCVRVYQVRYLSATFEERLGLQKLETTEWAHRPPTARSEFYAAAHPAVSLGVGDVVSIHAQYDRLWIGWKVACACPGDSSDSLSESSESLSQSRSASVSTSDFASNSLSLEDSTSVSGSGSDSIGGSGSQGGVVVPCCANAIPNTLNGVWTVFDVRAAAATYPCACAGTVNIPLVWDGFKWQGTVPFCLTEIEVFVTCGPGNSWHYNIAYYPFGPAGDYYRTGLSDFSIQQCDPVFLFDPHANACNSRSASLFPHPCGDPGIIGCYGSCTPCIMGEFSVTL